MTSCLILLTLLILAVPAFGEDEQHGVKATVKEAAKTGGHAARDGALTFGRSTGAFFHGGAKAAKKTWKENAARTKANARAGGRATKRAARGE